jgi:NAD(P)-dependent dehydrogenase (short-subunit alcohol dehydrogenase family)
MRAYSMSKLANLLFARELDRKAKREGLDITSVAVHPGYAMQASPDDPLSTRAWSVFASELSVGGDALVFAATEPSLIGGEAIGPGQSFQLKGAPVVLPTPKVRDEEAIAHRLWLISGQLTRVPW